MDLGLLFNRHRIWALAMLIIAAISGWFSLILLTNSAVKPIYVNKSQWVGLGFALLVGILVWINKCFTIIPYKHAN